MKGKKTNLTANASSIARSLHAVGDWWSLLIVRDAFRGSRCFAEFQKNLGLAKTILATRLRKLVAAQIMNVAPASDGKAHKEYVLTEKGESLYLVIVALWQWGEAFSSPPNELSGVIVDKEKRKRLPPLELRTEDGRVLGPQDFATRTGPQPKQS